MCGFIAYLGQTDSVTRIDVAQRMLDCIVHRGPDDHGLLDAPGCVLGFRRLSILDLSPLGHQPMLSADGNYAIVFNGEIYNFVELRRELEALGHSFRSSGDTEVLLAAYRQWGRDCLRRLNGMWAFVIHDKGRNIVFGSRDRFGIKPLFRWSDGRQTLLASEIKSIRASGLYRAELNLRRVAAYLYHDEIDTSSETFFKGIDQVPPGCGFEIGPDGECRQWAFWDLDAEPPHDFDDAPERFADLFEDAMRIHMRSDVPVGINLSGGLDSTAIICAAARIQRAGGSSEQLLAFHYRDAQFDEDRYVRDTLAQTDARLVTLSLTPTQLWDSLPEVLGFQDEPVHSMTAVVGFHLSGLARSNGIKVVLNGQGADETMAGYGNYFSHYWYELCRSGHIAALLRQLGGYVGAHGGSRGALLTRVLRHHLQTTLRGNALYHAMSAQAQRRRAQSQTWISPDLLPHLGSNDTAAPQDLRSVLSRSVREDPLPLYLRVEDRNAMAHSVEVRLPFLDWRLVSFVHRLPASRKLSDGWNKYLLRQGMHGYIPESVRLRVDKMGFPTSAGEWFRGPLYEPLRALLNDSALHQQELIDAKALLADLEAHRTGQANHSRRLFAAAQLHIWRQQARV